MDPFRSCTLQICGKCVWVCRQIAGLQAHTYVLMEIYFHISKPGSSLFFGRSCHKCKAKGHRELDLQLIYEPSVCLQWSKLCIHPGVVLTSTYRTTTSTDSTCALLGLGSDSSHTQEPCPSSSISRSLTQSKAWTCCDGWTQSNQPVFSLSHDHWDAKKWHFCQQDEEHGMARKYDVV